MHVSRLSIPVSTCLVLLSLALGLPCAAQVEPPPRPARAAQPAAQPGNPPAAAPRIRAAANPPAKLIKVAPDSITIRPSGAANPANAAGNDETFVLDNQQTRVMIGTVTAERLTVTGQRIRTMRFDRGEVADLEAGQFVHVTGKDGVAAEIQIVPDPDGPMPAPVVLLKADGKSITVAPAAAAGEAVPAGAGAGAAAGANPVAANAAAERTYTVDPQKTRVTVVEVVGERGGPGGRVTRTMTERRGTVADLQPGQQIELRARGDLAAYIRIVPPAALPPGPRPRADPAPRR